MEEKKNDLFQGLPDLDMNSSSKNIPFTLLPNRFSSCPVDKEVIYLPNREGSSDTIPFKNLNPCIEENHALQRSLGRFNHNLHSRESSIFYENQVSGDGSTTTRRSSSSYALDMRNQDASMIYQFSLELPSRSNYTFALEKKLGLYNLFETGIKQGQVIEGRLDRCNTCFEEFPNSRAFRGDMSSHSKMKVEDDKSPDGHPKRIKFDYDAQVSLPSGKLTKTPGMSPMNSSGIAIENKVIIPKFEEGWSVAGNGSSIKENVKEEPAEEENIHVNVVFNENIPPVDWKPKKEKDVQ